MLPNKRTMQNRTINFRYINKNTRLYLAYRPAPSSRKHQYLTRYIPQVSDKNVLWGWVVDNIAPYDISEKCVIKSIDLTEACSLATVLDMPLVVSIVEYCDMYDKSVVEEVFFWRTQKISQKV